MWEYVVWLTLPKAINFPWQGLAIDPQPWLTHENTVSGVPHARLFFLCLSGGRSIFPLQGELNTPANFLTGKLSGLTIFENIWGKRHGESSGTLEIAYE